MITLLGSREMRTPPSTVVNVNQRNQQVVKRLLLDLKDWEIVRAGRRVPIRDGVRYPQSPSRIPDLAGTALFADLGCRSRQDIQTSLLTSSGLLLLFFTFEKRSPVERLCNKARARASL